MPLEKVFQTHIDCKMNPPLKTLTQQCALARFPSKVVKKLV